MVTLTFYFGFGGELVVGTHGTSGADGVHGKLEVLFQGGVSPSSAVLHLFNCKLVQL